MIMIYLVFVVIEDENGGFKEVRWRVYAHDEESAIEKVKEKYDPDYHFPITFIAVSSPIPEKPIWLESREWDIYGNPK